jgi:GT2 family glycosyltransferase
MSRSKTNLDISVVIVSFNTKELLRKCLISIKEQFCGVSYEIIVVDNDSKDGSVEMLEEEFPSVSLIKNNYNAGISRGNNQGIKASRSDYILLANPDLEIVSDNVGDLLDYMEANPKVGMLGPKIFLPNGDIQTSATSFPTLFTVLAHHLGLKKLLPSDSARKLAIQSFGKVLGNPTCKYLRVYREAADPEIVDWVTSALLLIRKEVFSDIGYWDEDFFLYADEVDFQLRANKAGWRAVY